MEFSIITLLCRKYPFFHDVAGTADPGTLGVIIILPISQDTYKLVRAFGARFEDAPIQKTLRHPCIREGNMARAFSILRNIPKILERGEVVRRKSPENLEILERKSNRTEIPCNNLGIPGEGALRDFGKCCFIRQW